MSGSANTETGLERRLGLTAAVMSGLGVILGAGIYVLIGVAAGEAGNALWLAFVIAAIAAGFTGLSYARLGRLRPGNAPEFRYVSLAFGQGAAFLAGWLVLWAGIISAAAVALGFAGYLQHVLGIPGLISAIGLIVLSSIVVFAGIGQSIILMGILTIPTIIGLLVIIGISIPHSGAANLLEMPFGFSGVENAASLVFFAFLGFEGMGNLSEEMRNPGRDLPRAIMLVLGISALLYVLVSLSAINVLGWKELSGSSAPMAAVAGQALGAGADLFVSLASLAATASTVLFLLLAASRAMWAMSCAGVLPMTFCVIGKNRHTPWITIIIVGVLASLFAAIQNVGDVAKFTNFTVLLVFIAVNASAIRLFAANSGENILKRVLFGLISPVLGVLASLWLAVHTSLQAALFGIALLIAGTVTFWAMRLRIRTRQQQ